MPRSITFAVAVCCLCSLEASANDYLLSIEVHGYADTAQQNPQSQLLRRVEVIARPDAEYRSAVTEGKETLIFSGRLTPSDQGGFEAEVRYERRVDTQAEHGTPAFQVEILNTTVHLSEGKSFKLDGLKSRRIRPGQPDLKSKSAYVLTLDEHDPAARAERRAPRNNDRKRASPTPQESHSPATPQPCQPDVRSSPKTGRSPNDAQPPANSHPFHGERLDGICRDFKS